MNRQARVVIAGATGLAAFGVIWELSIRIWSIDPFVLQSPSEIVTEFAAQPTAYLEAAATTARHALAGLAISLAISVVLGAVLAMSRFLEEAVQPVLMLILVTPWIAYLSSLIIAFGGGGPPAVFLVSVVTLPAFTFAMVAGLRSADPPAGKLLASVDASRWEVLWRLRLPGALPTVFSAARFNCGLALAASYFVDGGNLDNEGLGAIGKSAQAMHNGAGLWTAIATTAALGVVLLAILTVSERVLLRWHVSNRQ